MGNFRVGQKVFIPKIDKWGTITKELSGTYHFDDDKFEVELDSYYFGHAFMAFYSYELTSRAEEQSQEEALEEIYQEQLMQRVDKLTEEVISLRKLIYSKQ
jgi:hypothetical protein